MTLELVRMQTSDYSASILGHAVPTTAVILFGKGGCFSVETYLIKI